MKDESGMEDMHAIAGSYIYKLKADSGYRATTEGRISAHRHGRVIAALNGLYDNVEPPARTGDNDNG